MANIAIFDLDYTLTQRGTWGRFVAQTVKMRPWLWLPLALSAGIMQARYKLGQVPRIRVKQAMMRWTMVGKSKSQLEAMAEDFAEAEVNSGLRAKAQSVLKRHREAGDTLIIASAAVDLIVDPIARRLGISHVLATDMKWEDGRLAPDFGSDNCYGPEKLERVKQFLAFHDELKQSDTLITFYSDSYSDLDLLRFSDVGIAVNPDSRLRAIAPDMNWEVQDWG